MAQIIAIYRAWASEKMARGMKAGLERDAGNMMTVIASEAKQ
jgi:hypothetical protein